MQGQTQRRFTDWLATSVETSQNPSVNKALHYSTGNSTEDFAITYKGKEAESYLTYD